MKHTAFAWEAAACEQRQRIGRRYKSGQELPHNVRGKSIDYAV